MKLTFPKKLFVITLLLLTGFLALAFMFQTFIFEDFYETKKTDSLISEINEFRYTYSNHLTSNKSIYSALKNFENKNGVKIAIFSLNGDLRFISDNSNDDVTDINILKEFCSNIFQNKELLSNILYKNQTIATTFNQNNELKNIGVASAISLTPNDNSIILCVSSIQPILEASQIISQLFIYIFAIATFIAIILAYIYSRRISKPLLRLNTVAIKMSEMDFSEKYPVDSDDEIGNLGRSFNFLSEKLESTLTELKKKNLQLSEDIEKERHIDSMRKDFIANVSHELKTPIGIIEGYAEGIKDGIVSGKEKELYLQTIIDESHKMGKLVSNMLELSKLESGFITPKLEIFNINRLINKMVNIFFLECSEKKLNLSFIQNVDYAYVEADRFQLEQVLTNLITNAIKYTPINSDIKISISDHLDSSFIIKVLNTNASIPHNSSKLFDKFYRLDESRDRSHDSTGLGLAIVKNILDLHGFKYDLMNINSGVLFFIIIPKAELNEEI